MAVGNAIVNTARFKPLTVAEWSAPLRENALRHDAMENALIGLSSEAEEYDRYIRENPNDPISLKYKDYINKLDEQSALLAEQGITPQSRRDLLELYRDYNRNIKPMKSGVAAYQEYKDTLSKNNLLPKKNYNVYDFIKDPLLRPDYISKKDLQLKIGTLTANAAKGISPQPTGQYYGDPKYKQEIYTTGIPPEVIANSLANAQENNITNRYEAGIREYLDSIGYDDLPDETKQEVNDMMSAVMMGNSGYGTSVYNGLKYANTLSTMNNRGKKGSGRGSDKKDKPVFAGTVSSRKPQTKQVVKDNYSIEVDPLTGKNKKVNNPEYVNQTETSKETVNTTNAELPSNALPIKADVAKKVMKNQFSNLFSNSKQTGKELASNAYKYDFYYVPNEEYAKKSNYRDDMYEKLSIANGTLYIVPKSEYEIEDKDYQYDNNVPQSLSDEQFNAIYGNNIDATE